MHHSSSPSSGSSVSSIYRASSPIETSKNRPSLSSYIKAHKNISFSFSENSTSFQHGHLGDNDTFLIGTLHLNYPKACSIKSVFLNFKGTEKTSWFKAQARTKVIYTGENTFIEQSNKIWEAFDEFAEIQSLDIPFKIQLPYNLPETINTDIGSVRHILRATVNVKGLLGTNVTHVAKILCPLKRIVTLDHSSSSFPYKICGESQSGIEYTFMLPPDKQLNIGSFVSIPMLLRFIRPNVSIERIDVSLKTSMVFQCSDHNEKRNLDIQIASLVITRSDLRYLESSMPHYDYGECTYTINLFIPPSAQPAYQGRFINISHKLSINVCLYGCASGFLVEEQVKIANVVEKNASPKNIYSSFPIDNTQNPNMAYANGILNNFSHSSESFNNFTGPFSYPSYDLQLTNQLRQQRSLPELPQGLPFDDDSFHTTSLDYQRSIPFDINNYDRIHDRYNTRFSSDISNNIYQLYSPQHSRSETPQTPPSSYSTTTSSTNIRLGEVVSDTSNISQLDSISSTDLPNSSKTILPTSLSLPPYYRYPSGHHQSSSLGSSNDYTISSSSKR
ncbi:3243_t:CDS:1 [Scutellospora calospora]|uniref:3243_t:CDS:1 n=1 Tax=Scutellospora calospora TaxID=85575 RepID=A0ACA9NAJ9_9GLOM|nr:3243_t:CDS:1 [Scutellospora calospora]